MLAAVVAAASVAHCSPASGELTHIPLVAEPRPFVHDHVVRAAMSVGAGETRQKAEFSSKLANLPDLFDSVGHFEFIETLEGAGASSFLAGDDSGTKLSGSESSEKDGGKKEMSKAKPIPKKLKCSCSFAKLDAPQASFIEAMERPRRPPLLRSAR